MLDDSPKFILVDEQSDDQIVHLLSLRKADGPAYQPLDSRPQVDVLALDPWYVFLPYGVLLRVHCSNT
jgi:hypothetical protein